MTKKLTKEDVTGRLSAQGRGIELTGPYLNNRTPTTFKGKCGHEWTAAPYNILNGRGCPRCVGKYQTAESVNDELAPRGLEVVGGIGRIRDLTMFECSEGHRFESRLDHVKRGSGCPRCAGNARVTREALNAVLKPRGIQLTGEYLGDATKTVFTCACGHSWLAKPTHVKRVSGCPLCAKSGIVHCDTGYVYVMTYPPGLCKIGVSNKPERRQTTLTRAAGVEIDLIALYMFGRGTGREALEAERAAHAHFADRNAALKGFDGATELFNVKPEEVCEFLRDAGGVSIKVAG